jgi:hypothetical protein
MDRASQPPPLTRPELERLWRWERVMIRYYAMAMTAIAIAAALAVTYGETPWARRSVLGLVLVLAATVVQFRERCPRCGSRLGTQSRLLLPDKCRKCGVLFERPPKLDSELD